MTIKKVKGGWEVESKKGKNLGKSKTHKGAVNRLRQVEYFKHNSKKSSHGH